jgi:hypothetical protein
MHGAVIFAGAATVAGGNDQASAIHVTICRHWMRFKIDSIAGKLINGVGAIKKVKSIRPVERKAACHYVL